MPSDMMLTGATGTVASESFDCLGYDKVFVKIWSDEADPDAEVAIESDGPPWFTLGTTDLSSANPDVWSVPATSTIRVEVLTNASGKAVNAEIVRSKNQGGPG